MKKHKQVKSQILGTLQAEPLLDFSCLTLLLNSFFNYRRYSFQCLSNKSSFILSQLKLYVRDLQAEKTTLGPGFHSLRLNRVFLHWSNSFSTFIVLFPRTTPAAPQVLWNSVETLKQRSTQLLNLRRFHSCNKYEHVSGEKRQYRNAYEGDTDWFAPRALCI